MLVNVDVGHWFYPVNINPDEVYDREYVEKYNRYAITEMGDKILNFRSSFTKMMNPERFNIVDIGVGNGSFVEEIGCYGFDVNKVMIDRMRKAGNFIDVYDKGELRKNNISIFCFFDSLEHIRKPEEILNNIPVGGVVVTSIPILPDERDYKIKDWKHARFSEHYHYFTNQGFINYMNKYGFMLKQFSKFETDVGRQDITTFGFCKVK